MNDEETTKPLFLTDFPTDMRKCPLHNAWIQKHAVKGNTVRTRYCPRCDLVRLHIEAKAKAAAPPTQPSKIRIMKI